jgi:predicted porin
MKKKILALAALATIAGAAQADVTLYGLLDVGFASEAHSNGANGVFPFTLDSMDVNKVANGNNRATALTTGGLSMSRFGIKGTEDIGGGLSAGFVLESAINPTTGSLASGVGSVASGKSTATGFSSIDGQLFSRAAYVKIAQQGIGELQLGRTTALGLDQVAKFDPLNAAGLYSPLGYSGTLGGGLGATENARLNNSIKYLGGMDQFNWGYQHKFGSTTSSEVTDFSTVDALTLGYSTSDWSVQGTYQNVRDGVAMATSEYTAYGSFTGNIANMNGYMLTGLYKATDTLTVKLGGEHFTVSAPTDTGLVGTGNNGNLTYYGTTVSSIVGTTNSSSAGISDFGSTNKVINMWWVGGEYKVAANATLAVGYYSLQQNYGAGTYFGEQIISSYLDYNFTKMTDAYVGFTANNFNGNKYSNATANTYVLSNNTFGAGLRVRF